MEDIANITVIINRGWVDHLNGYNAQKYLITSNKAFFKCNCHCLQFG